MKLPGLAGIYLEDSYVLAIHQCEARFAFELEAVLTPESPAYVPPRPGEQYCYAMATLVFPNVTAVEWIRRSGRHYTDAAGEEDLGNIGLLDVEGDMFTADGDWGRVRIHVSQPYIELKAASASD